MSWEHGSPFRSLFLPYTGWKPVPHKNPQRRESVVAPSPPVPKKDLRHGIMVADGTTI